MNKEKEIEEMATVLPKLIVCDGGYGWDDEQEVDCWETARNLINAGYGNVKQAVKEFAEHLKDCINIYNCIPIKQICSLINNLLTKLYGADE